MKYFHALLLSLPLLGTCPAWCQQSIIRGIVSVHNSETNTGKRLYVSNAQVEDKDNRATPTTTGAGGEFKLVYVGTGEKKPVSFNVSKPGLQVVDPSKLTAITGQDLSIEVSMANPDSITAYRVKLFNIGKTEMEKRLEEVLRTKNQQLLSLKNQGSQRAGMINELQYQLDSIQKRINDQAAGFARHFSQLNLDDVSKQFRLAFQHFQKGNTELALTVLSRMNLYATVTTLLTERKTIAKSDNAHRRLARDAADALALKAELHKTLFEFDSAVVCYEYALQLDPFNDTYLTDVADLLPDLGRNQDARINYNKALAIYRKQAVSNPELYLPKIAHALRQLGTFAYFWDTDVDTRDENFDFNKSKAAYREAVGIYRSLASKDASTWLPELAATLFELAGRIHYYPEMDSTTLEAIPIYQEVIAIYTKLATDNSKLFAPLLARANRYLAEFYEKKFEFKNAKEALANARVIYQRLADNKTYPAAADNINYCTELAEDMEENKAKFPAAAAPLLAKMEKYRLQAKTDPANNLEELAKTLYNLGALLQNKKELFIIHNARPLLLEALAIYKTLAIKNPVYYRPLIAEVLGELGDDYAGVYKYMEARNCYLEAMILYEQSAKEHPDKYADIIKKLRELVTTIDVDESSFGFATDSSLIWGIEVYGRLAKTAQSTYNSTLNAFKTGLVLKMVSHAWFFLMEGNFEAAEHMSVKARQMAEKLPSPPPDLLPFINSNLAHALLYQDKYKQATEVYGYLKTKVSADGKSFAVICLEDLDAMEKKNITQADVPRIRRFLIE